MRPTRRRLGALVAVAALLLVSGTVPLAEAAGAPPRSAPPGPANPNAGSTPPPSIPDLSGHSTARPTLLPGSIRNYHFASVQLAASEGAPTWLAYDSGDQAFYVAQSNGTVAVVPAGSSTEGVTIAVGAAPFGVAYDPTEGRIFVANTGSDTLSVISDSTNSVVASVPVGGQPYGVAYDGAIDRLFVANGGSDTVSVVDASTLQVVANISVGVDPIGIAYDPVNGYVFVANGGSGDISVLSAANNGWVATLAAGNAPYGVAVDGRTGYVFVSNVLSGNVTVVGASGTAVLATVPIGGTPEGLAYDSENQTIWVADGAISVVVINASNQQVLQYLLFDPLGAVYDPTTNEVCVTNAANATFQCLVPSRYGDAVNLTFTETGLAAGVPWAVSVGGTILDDGLEAITTTSTIIVPVFVGWDVDYSVLPLSGYQATPASGFVSISFYDYPNPVDVAIAFSPEPRNLTLTFVQHGLRYSPTSLPWWGVTVGGTSYSTPLGELTVPGENASYTYTAATVPGYVAPPAQEVTLAGHALVLAINYSIVTYPVEFVEIGLPSGASWAATLNAATQRSTSSTIVFDLPNGSYAWSAAGPVGFPPSPAAGTVLVEGTADSETITFQEGPSRLTAAFTYSPPSSCGGPFNVTFTSEVSGGTPPYSYLWSFSEGTPYSTDADPTHEFSGPSLVTLVVTDSLGAAANYSEMVEGLYPPCQTSGPAFLSGDAPAILALAVVVALAGTTVAFVLVARRPPSA